MTDSSPGGAPPPECRICRDGASAGQLHPACRCATLVHAACLRRWVAHRSDALFPLLLAGGRKVCEVCRAPFRPEVLHEAQALPVSDDADRKPMEGTCGRMLRSAVGRADRVCEYFMSVEGCLLIFLFVLAVMGHALFVMGMYDGASTDQYSIARLALGFANAVLTISLLVLVQKIVARWLREADFLHAVASASIYCNDVEAQQQAPTESRGGRCGVFYQVLLGGVLSVLAAAEIFFLMRQLPFGTLA